MAILRCNNIKPEYNYLLFKIKKTPGDIRTLKASGDIIQRPYPEGYFMNRNKAKKPNPFIKFLVRMYEEMKAVADILKTERENALSGK
jgi:hypothetical protein